MCEFYAGKSSYSFTIELIYMTFPDKKTPKYYDIILMLNHCVTTTDASSNIHIYDID